MQAAHLQRHALWLAHNHNLRLVILRLLDLPFGFADRFICGLAFGYKLPKFFRF